MDAQTAALLDEIRAFLARHGMKETTFGLLAVNDGKFFGRLAGGGNVTLKTVSRLREFMDTYEPPGPGPLEAPLVEEKRDGEGPEEEQGIGGGEVQAGALTQGEAA